MDTITKQKTHIPLHQSKNLDASLMLPDHADGIILFARSNDGNHLQNHINFLADHFYQENYASLLFNLLTHDDKEPHYGHHFNIALLTQRLKRATDWIKEEIPELSCNIGYFGVCTGAAAALNASTLEGDEIEAIVSDEGRADMALNNLRNVTAPTLLIVSSLNKHNIIDLNEKAYEKLECERDFKVIESCSRQFDESNRMHETAKYAGSWFNKYMKL